MLKITELHPLEQMLQLIIQLMLMLLPIKQLMLMPAMQLMLLHLHQLLKILRLLMQPPQHPLLLPLQQHQQLVELEQEMELFQLPFLTLPLETEPPRPICPRSTGLGGWDGRDRRPRPKGIY